MVVTEIYDVALIFIDTIDSDKTETFEVVFAFESIWLLAIVTAIEIDTYGLIITQ